MLKSKRISNKEQGILKSKGISNNEQGMSNIEVLACLIYTVVVLSTFRTSTFKIPCSLFVIPFNFDIQNSLFIIRYSLKLGHSKFLVHYSLFP